MRHRAEPEARRRLGLDLGEGRAAVATEEDAVMVLTPDRVRRRAALGQAVRVLGQRLERLIGRHVGGAQPLAAEPPAGPGIVAEPDAGGRDAERQAGGVARVDADRMDAGLVVPAAEPVRPGLVVPQRLVQRPAFAAIVGPEQPARDGAGPQRARPICATRLQRPDHRHAGRVGGVGAGRRKGRRGQLGPAFAVIVGAVQLHAEMAEVERRIEGAVARIGQHRADRIAEEGRAGEAERRAVAGEAQQPLLGRDIERRHLIPPKAPAGRRPRRLRRPRRRAPSGRRPAGR